MHAVTKAYQAAAEHLALSDPLLVPVIARVGHCTIRPHTDYYRELVESIISQQLSVKAAATILQRFVALFDNTFPTPQQILTCDIALLRGAGLSRAKAGYIRDLAGHILEGNLKMAALPRLSNDEIIHRLTAIKGIGEWTAHMFLIFSLGRLDVLATGDLGVRSAAKKLYGLCTLPTPHELHALADERHWHPYESVACWYLWQSLTIEPARADRSQN